MPRDYKVYLDDVLEAIKKINKYTSGMSQEAFFSDPKTIDAVVRNLEVLGEAIKKVPESIRAKYPDVEWKKVASLRDILIHEYFGINVQIIWDIVKNKLLVLEKQITSIIKNHP